MPYSKVPIMYYEFPTFVPFSLSFSNANQFELNLI